MGNSNLTKQDHTQQTWVYFPFSKAETLPFAANVCIYSLIYWYSVDKAQLWKKICQGVQHRRWNFLISDLAEYDWSFSSCIQYMFPCIRKASLTLFRFFSIAFTFFITLAFLPSFTMYLINTGLTWIWSRRNLLAFVPLCELSVRPRHENNSPILVSGGTAFSDGNCYIWSVEKPPDVSLGGIWCRLFSLVESRTWWGGLCWVSQPKRSAPLPSCLAYLQA